MITEGMIHTESLYAQFLYYLNLEQFSAGFYPIDHHHHHHHHRQILLLFLTLQSLVDLRIFFNFRIFSTEHTFYGVDLSSHAQPTMWKTSVSLLSGSSPLTRLAWKALPAATLPPA
jgi:hypothetical protein